MIELSNKAVEQNAPTGCGFVCLVFIACSFQLRERRCQARRSPLRWTRNNRE